MRVMASQITGVAIVYSTIYSGAYQRKHQSSASLAFVKGIHWWSLDHQQHERIPQYANPHISALSTYLSGSAYFSKTLRSFSRYSFSVFNSLWTSRSRVHTSGSQGGKSGKWYAEKLQRPLDMFHWSLKTGSKLFIIAAIYSNKRGYRS